MKVLLHLLFMSSIICAAVKTPGDYDLARGSVANLVYWEYHQGDISDRSNIALNGLTWQSIELYKYKNEITGIHWLKKEIYFAGALSDTTNLMLSFYGVSSAFEIYWDGELIGSNGRVGASENEEHSGSINFTIKLNRRLFTEGFHRIAVRFSNYNKDKHFNQAAILLAPESHIEALRLNQTFEMSLYSGLFFATFIFCISVYIVGWRDRSFLFFSGFNLFYCLISIWYLLIANSIISNSMYHIFGRLFDHGHLIALVILLFFTLSFFERKLKWTHIILLTIISVLYIIISLYFTYGIYVNTMYVIFTFYTLAVSVSQIRNNISGTYFIIAAMFIGFLYSVVSIFHIFTIITIPGYMIVNFTENILFISLIMIAVSRKIQERNKKYREALLLSHRLEAELLKKSIQPHFMMNTLLSIKSWLIKDSEVAEKIIDAFASQFRIISQISSEKLIPIEKEIELCKLHLELMGHRYQAGYEFITEGNCTARTIPPLILHTLVENGLTHAYLPKEDGIFRLICLGDEKEYKYILRNNGSQIKQIINEKDKSVSEGLGLKYVKTRLEECYPGKWNLDYGIVDNNWEVQISINI